MAAIDVQTGCFKMFSIAVWDWEIIQYHPETTKTRSYLKEQIFTPKSRKSDPRRSAHQIMHSLWASFSWLRFALPATRITINLLNCNSINKSWRRLMKAQSLLGWFMDEAVSSIGPLQANDDGAIITCNKHIIVYLV